MLFPDVGLSTRKQNTGVVILQNTGVVILQNTGVVILQILSSLWTTSHYKVTDADKCQIQTSYK